MKKLCFFALLLIPSICFAKTYYEISESDFKALKACMLRIENYFEEKGAESGYCWGWDVYGINNYLLKSIEDSKVDTDSDALRRIKFAEAAKYASEHWNDSDSLKELRQKISNLEDKITLIKMELINKKDKEKSK